MDSAIMSIVCFIKILMWVVDSYLFPTIPYKEAQKLVKLATGPALIRFCKAPYETDDYEPSTAVTLGGGIGVNVGGGLYVDADGNMGS